MPYGRKTSLNTGMPLCKKYDKNLLLVSIIISVFALGFFSACLFYHAGQLNGQVTLKPLAPATYTAKANVVAVSSDGTGVLSLAEVEVRQGAGRVLFNINPFVEPDTQQSVETAARVAENFTGKSLKDMDAIYTINPPSPGTQLIGGPSAGAALTVATIAAIEKKQVNPDIAITGTINADGSIGQIGGVIEKATAAAEFGKKLFLVPRGQSKVVYYEQQVTQERRGGWILQRIQYVPKELDLNKYLLDQNYSMRVKEISSIQEAVNYMIE